MTTNELILTDYIDSPQVRVFQAIAGTRLEKLRQGQQWSILTALFKASTVAKSSGSGFVDTRGALMYLVASDAPSKCLDVLNGFPTDRVDQLIGAIEDICNLRRSMA